MQNSLFASEKVIEASRDFVCIRIETFENKESEKMVRSLLNGRFANTAFCIFDPHGKRRLTNAGRGPNLLGGGRGEDKDVASVARHMKRIASRYSPSANQADAVLQDFHSFRQALNVASADQRLLVFVNANEKERIPALENLQQVFSDEELVGRFHLDFLDDEDTDWHKTIKSVEKEPGIMVIRSGKFGVDGTAVDRLKLDSSSDEIRQSLLTANKKFASAEKRKSYSAHVQQGRRKGIYFENEIPYGEDKDGDGKADKARSRRR